ncbi:hypothetical protein EGT74_00020 [Chitinophaga lutea]|uniref:Vitamin K epoxide reductase domain-containing protein n=1 Tax=Chitinophaga lutea TaxID=2488634 RepID=A0A3N4Q3D8_9BACT|nr:vitamin K epoxide reductase family protein [Chitinophaga lutea]RPE11981.1 hypothetical protein EGT74_00020 [Chitinophaga lutea]
MALEFNTRLPLVGAKYSELLNIPLDKINIAEQLQVHPDYPSLYSLSDILHRNGVTNNAYAVETDSVFDFTPPFITYLKNLPTGKDFVIVTEISKTSVNYYSGHWKKVSVSREQFISSYQGIILQGKNLPKENTQTKLSSFLRSKLSFPIVGGIIILFLILGKYFSILSIGDSKIFVPLLALKLFGAIITTLLLTYEVDKSNSLIKNICTGSKELNCDAVLKSKGAKIWGHTWSEIGFYYFFSTAIILLSSEITTPFKGALLASLSLAATPFIIFSFYYQFKVVKQFCPLCLGIQVTLIVELIIALASLNQYQFSAFRQFSPIFLFPVIIALLLPVVCWKSLKRIFIKASNEKRYKYAYKRILNSPDYFNHQLNRETSAPEGWREIGMLIGNPNASITILKVCNPYCGPCAKAHHPLEQILKVNSNVNMRIIFTASTHEGDPRTAPVRHFISTQETEGPEKFSELLSKWYEAPIKDIAMFASNGTHKIPTDIDKRIKSMEKWCEDAKISHTPTFYINGKKLPDRYSIEDLKTILLQT